MGNTAAVQLDLDRIEDMVLLILTDEFATSEDEFVSLDQLRDHLPKFGPNPIREAIRGLKTRELIAARIDRRPVGPLGMVTNQMMDVEVKAYRVTRRGLKEVQQLNADYAKELRDELVAKDSNETVAEGDDRWEPLPIDRTTEAFEEFISTTNEAVERIEADNGYAASLPEERAGLLAAMKTGLNMIADGVASRGIVRSMLLHPLRYVAEKFAGTSIGEIAKKAFEVAWKFFSGFF